VKVVTAELILFGPAGVALVWMILFGANSLASNGRVLGILLLASFSSIFWAWWLDHHRDEQGALNKRIKTRIMALVKD
jgi:hypothetical protein